MKLHLTILALAIILTLPVGCRGVNTKGGKGGNTASATTSPEASASQKRPAPPTQYGYRVLETYPHATDSYTQGLFWHEGHMYESTGQYGTSHLMRVDLATGKALQKVALERKYFGEGSAIMDGKIYLLTWQEGRAMVYDAETFRLLRMFSYNGEGWGITSDGEKLYMSDGTDTIYVRNPETFALERRITVTNGRHRLNYINELEWIDGEIWANVYLSDAICRIDPQTGRVTGVVNLDGLQDRADYVDGQTDVLNGIAWDEATKSIWVTGKNWNKLYRIEVFEK